MSSQLPPTTTTPMKKNGLTPLENFRLVTEQHHSSHVSPAKPPKPTANTTNLTLNMNFNLQ